MSMEEETKVNMQHCSLGRITSLFFIFYVYLYFLKSAVLIYSLFFTHLMETFSRLFSLIWALRPSVHKNCKELLTHSQFIQY